MPSRKDAYALASQLLKLAGVQSVVRGRFFPEETGDAYPISTYPVAAYVERNTEQTNPDNYSYQLSWDVEIDLFVWTDSTDTPATGPQWDQMDDLHDGILQQFAQYFAGDADNGGIASQTTVFKITKFEPWWWYSQKPGVVAATFTLECQMKFA